MTRLANLSGTWYIIDFGQRTFWTTTSSTMVNYLRNTAGMKQLPDGDTSILNGFTRITP